MSFNALIPVWLDWSGRNVVVIGLGNVGQRRARLFQKAGATVIGVDPMPVIQGQVWGELIRDGLELRSEPYSNILFDELREQQLRPELVIACANEKVNEAVVRDAQERGLWVCSATTSSVCPANVQLGALASGDFVQIAVHSGNAAPGLSSALREIVSETLLGGADRLAAESTRWRPWILKNVLNSEARHEFLDQLKSKEWIVLENQELGQGVEAMRQKMNELCTKFGLAKPVHENRSGVSVDE